MFLRSNNLLTLDQNINDVILGIFATRLTMTSHLLKVFLGIVYAKNN